MAASLDTRLARYLQLSDSLHQRILDGEWKPGDTIPAESILAEEYDVALGTMRKAIGQLMSNGLLERRHGVGTFVRRADFSNSLFRFFRFTDDNGERVMPQGRILNVQKTNPPTLQAHKLGISKDDEAIWISRLRLIKNVPVLIEDIWLPLPQFSPLLGLSPSDYPDLLYPLYEELCGAAVVSASEELMVEKVSAEHARVLGIKTGDPVILIDRTTTNVKGQPIEWRRSRGAAEKFRYQVNIC
ncbi:GntR family transcriptional regulator [Vibrio penaeicida]|uniref:GntR family transcriptional regulator n=1 Tax=Vibrio penaeicida TaxID=104609 RepID=UPI000CEA6CFB|nr:GntR family transcriptional regulator [Vibrio penaeicida]